MKNCELPIKNYGHIILAPIGPLLLYQISSNEVRILIDMKEIPKSDILKVKHVRFL